MKSVLQYLRFALRQLRRSPGVAVTAIFMLALDIGPKTVILTLLDQVLLLLPAHSDDTAPAAKPVAVVFKDLWIIPQQRTFTKDSLC